MPNIVYETTNLINGKYYIGVHKNNGSNYLGSGVVLNNDIKKYGKENFIRETLKEFDNEQDAYNYEKEIVNKELIDNKYCYNLVIGGGNPPTLCGKEHYLFGKKIPKHICKKMKDNHQDYSGKNNPNYGKIMTPEQKKKISVTKKKNYIKENHPNFGIKFSEERCKKMSTEHIKYTYYINGNIFNTCKNAGEYFGVNRSTISNWCNNKNKPKCYRIKIKKGNNNK